MAEDSSEIVREQSESVAATKQKVLGDGPSFFQNQAYALSNQGMAGMQTINQAMISKAAESMINTSPAESAGDASMAGILAKMMQSTPPLTSGQSVPGQGVPGQG